MAKKYPVSPVGVAVYPRLNSPDTKFDEAGVYKTKLVVPQEQAEEMIALIEAGMSKSAEEAKEKHTKGKKPKRADPPYVVDEDAGTVTFSFKAKASGVRKKDGEKWSFRPALFDKTGKPWGDAIVGGGSKLQASFEIRSFYTALVGAGVTLSLKAVMVKDLVAYQGGTADSFGFDSEAAEEGQEKDEENEDGDEKGDTDF